MKLVKKKIDKSVLLELVNDRLISVNSNMKTKEILKELVNFYENSNNIIELCTRKELNLLNELLNNNLNKYIKKNNLQFEFDNLTSKFIIDENFEIYDELVSSVKKALVSIEYGKKVNEDKIKRGIVAICKVCGKIDLKDLYKIMENIYGVDASVVNYLINSKFINFYIKLINREELLYRDYSNLDIKVKLNYNFNSLELDSIFYNNYDTNNDKIKKMYNYLISSPNYPVLKKILDSILVSSSQRDKLYEALEIMYKDREIFDVFNDGLDEMLKYYKRKTGIILYENILNRILDYTNRKYEVSLKRILEDSDIPKVKEYFLNNKEMIISSFISEEAFSLEEGKVLENIKNSECASFILVKSGEYLEFMNKDGKIYMAKNIENIYNEYVMADAYLIMYEGSIIPVNVSIKENLIELKDTIEKVYESSSKVYIL